ncbi:hypothetical protein GOY07_00660 [Wolbachia endosymbiont of Litomosoides sigmodontis]|uniref:hypothetical protein n=1 Tax=Wolbachia endosymbiont of Litomosoides sigmodontis TaxID=80850 RepID=UPI00158DE102|nr:hypothetical protein [Wolbachia endosymbiont of Litomosoides sigmodontis]QKX02755.1 hypothetical protein GOY07_00660 [Wolbachia endosymbiont of Litomosoides sigmodontis]
MNTVVSCEKVFGSNNDKKEPILTLGKQQSISKLGEKKKLLAGFDIPLSVFRHKSYDSDFFTSWYNVSSEIFKEINRTCREKLLLNLALSVLMLPYIAVIALGLVIYNRFQANSKTQNSSEKNKIERSKVSESTVKRLVYGFLAAIATLVNIAVLIVLIVPATLALATFYFLNKELSRSLSAAFKVSAGLYRSEHQNIAISFHEAEVTEPNIAWDMEIKFPPQFEQLLRDLYEDKNDKLFVTRDSEHNTVLKLSANIHLRNSLITLHNEIKEVLNTSIQEFARTMEELIKLEKKDIIYDKLGELLNGFRLRVVNSVGPKLTSRLMQDAYGVAFIQAIKIAQGEGMRKEGFSLEERLKEVLVKEELKSQGKELSSKKDIIIEDLENAGIKVPKDLKEYEFSVYEAEWRYSKEVRKRTFIEVSENKYLQETKTALGNAKEEIQYLKELVLKRYNDIYKELEKMHENWRNGNLKNGTLKRRLEDLFKLDHDDQEIEQRLIESRIKAIRALLNRLDDGVKQSLMEELNELEAKTSSKVDGFVERTYLEIKQYEMQRLLQKQKKGVLDLCRILKEYEPGLAEMIEIFRRQGHLEVEQALKDQNERLKIKLNGREKGHPCTKLIKVLLERNERILKALEQLELFKEELLINEKTKSDYKEELTSREKIKFAVIEDELLDVFKKNETFDGEAIKKLLEKAELEYCLAEKCIKYPVIKTKDNVKHFCQALLSPLISNLAENIINNVPKDNKSGLSRFLSSCKVGLGYIKMGWSATKKNESTEGKALDVAHDTYKEVETLLKYFESSYEEVGALVGDVFSDDGETFKKNIWPKIKDHLCGMWDRFFKDIEFTLVSKNRNICQETKETVSAKLNGLVTQEHKNPVNELCSVTGA